MPKLIFISYRRSDSQHAAHGLYAQLKGRFGPSRVFMDVNTRKPGDRWPDRIIKALNDASLMLVVIGPHWLTAADKYGRRRLDMEEDWVRREVQFALEKDLPTIPLLVGGVVEMPPREGLPEVLTALSERDEICLHDTTWDVDLNGLLIETLKDKYGLIDCEKPVKLPAPHVNLPPLTDAELSEALESLEGWEPVESMVPGEYPKPRQELRKAYHFKSFARAVDFMAFAVPVADALKHHPRWENQWKTVTVHLSTWDIRNRISRLDVELAQRLDAAYKAFKAAAPAARPKG